MHRTEGANNAANLFTDGPPGTTVEEDWLNAIQEEIANVIEEAGLTLQTAGTDARTQLKQAFDLLYATPQKRPKFTYNGGAAAYTVKLSNGTYKVKDKVATWFVELTTNAIAAPLAVTFYYLYLDYSAIVTGSPITANELIWSSTVPVYSNTYGGWYNGDDLCIFAVLTNGGPANIYEFYHDGDFISWCDTFEIISTSPSNAWTDQNLRTALAIPGFVTRGSLTFALVGTGAANPGYWRPNGSSGAGLFIATVDSVVDVNGINTIDVITDSNGVIEIKFGNASVTDEFHAYSAGWYLPVGM